MGLFRAMFALGGGGWEQIEIPVKQFHNHAQWLKVKNSGGPLDNQTWQTGWKTAALDKRWLCEYENQTLEAFVAASRLYAKFDCPVARQNFLPLRLIVKLAYTERDYWMIGRQSHGGGFRW